MALRHVAILWCCFAELLGRLVHINALRSFQRGHLIKEEIERSLNVAKLVRVASTETLERSFEDIAPLRAHIVIVIGG